MAASPPTPTAVTEPAAAPTTRERLVAAAIEVFTERGYDGARVGEIARAAGLTTGAIYANYPGKAELLLDAIRTRAAAELDALLEEMGDRHERAVLEVLGGRLGRADPPGSNRPLLLDAVVAARRDPEVAARVAPELARREARLSGVIRRGQASGTLDPDLDTDTVVRFCVTLALGSIVVRALDLAPTDPDAWDQLVARLLDAAAPPATPTPAGDRDHPDRISDTDRGA